MNVFHIDLPRGLSFSIKPLDYLTARKIESNGGHSYKQLDLNPYFWEYLLTHEKDCLMEQVYEFNNQLPSYNLYIINQITNILKQKSAQAGIVFNAYGVSFPDEIKLSSGKLKNYLNNAVFVQWYFEFLNATEDISIGVEESELISLGIDSANGLVQAAAMAMYIKERYPGKHVILARHEYENFTLADCIEDLVKNKDFFDIFDSIACDSEKRCQTLSGLANYIATGDESSLVNIALRNGESFTKKQSVLTREQEDIHSCNNRKLQDDYFNSTVIPRAKMTYLMSLMGNTCYYGKCTFCVQNNKYKSNKKRREDILIDLCVDRIEELVACYNIKSINFLDQAVSPGTLKKFCNRIIEKNIKFSWYIRMLFHESLSDELITLLSQAGCKEILFGMESVNPQTLKMMKKVKSRMDDEQRIHFFLKLSRNNIDVCLNIITHFPTESDADFIVTTAAFLEKCRKNLGNITYVINRFSLFRNSEIYYNPSGYNIRSIIKSSGYDMQITYDYIDGFARNSLDESELTASVHKLVSPCEPDGKKIKTPVLLYNWLNYLKDSSLSLYYRRTTGKFIKDEWTIEFQQSDLCRYYPSVYPAAKRSIKGAKLIIGANSYLGQNIVKNSNAKGIIISSRSMPNKIIQDMDVPFVKQDLVDDNIRLLSASPEIMEIVSRPLSPDFDINLKFYSHLKSLINTYCNRKHLKNIRFYSTQLVYQTPANSVRINSSEKEAPEEVYEYFKVEFEVFLKYISRKHGVNIEIYRLPLLFGGFITEKQKNIQLIYQWMESYKNGHAWSFNHGNKKKYGNSWLNTEDFTKWITKKEFENGYHVINVSSGDFTYWALAKCFMKQFNMGNSDLSNSNILAMPESCFFINNESELEPVSIYDEISATISRQVA